MRNCLEFNLPSHTSIYNWMPVKNLLTGENECMTEKVKEVVRNLSVHDRNAILLFDELKIRRDLVYDDHNDMIQGFEDLSDLGRKSKVANYVLVFMVRGIFTKYKYLVSYYSSEKPVTGNKLKPLILQNIKMSQQMGLTIRATICDQGSGNRKLYRELGGTTTNTHHIVDGKKCFMMYDPPHLIKSIRNNLIDADMITPDGKASWEVVKKLFNNEQTNTTKLCPKLTSAHIFPNNFEKMRTRPAIEVFSRTVAAALRTANNMNVFPKAMKPTVLSSAVVFEKLDEFVDTVMCSSLYSKNANKQPIKRNNNTISKLKELANWFEGCTFAKKNPTYCINGIIMTINSIIELSSGLLDEYPCIDFVFCGRYRQDPLENAFSTVRNKGGHCKNPSVFEFSRIMAQMTSLKILKNTNVGSYDDDNDELLTAIYNYNDSANVEDEHFFKGSAFGDIEQEDLDTVLQFLINEKIEIVDNIKIDSKDHNNAANDHDDEIDSTTNGNFIIESTEQFYVNYESDEDDRSEIDDAALRYYIGYVIYKCNNKINCDLCTHELLKSDDKFDNNNEYFIYYKIFSLNNNFGSLHPPTDALFCVSKLCVKVFSTFFKNSPQMLNI